MYFSGCRHVRKLPVIWGRIWDVPPVPRVPTLLNYGVKPDLLLMACIDVSLRGKLAWDRACHTWDLNMACHT